jgi:hypothetical protein
VLIPITCRQLPGANFGTPLSRKRNEATRVGPDPFGDNQDLRFFSRSQFHSPHSQVVFADHHLFSSLLPRVFQFSTRFLLIAFFLLTTLFGWKLQRVAAFFPGPRFRVPFLRKHRKRVNPIGATSLSSLQTYDPHTRLPRCRPARRTS